MRNHAKSLSTKGIFAVPIQAVSHRLRAAVAASRAMFVTTAIGRAQYVCTAS